MPQIRYRVDVDFEKPALTNATYGVFSGIMQLVTGDEPYILPNVGAVPGLLSESNLKVPAQSINIHNGGLLSTGSTGSFSVSNTQDFSGFLAEQQMFPSYKFVSMYEIYEDSTETIIWSGVITSYVITPASVVFSLGNSLQRILKKTPGKTTQDLSYGVISDNQSTKSNVVFPKITGFHQGIDTSIAYETPVFNGGDYDRVAIDYWGWSQTQGWNGVVLGNNFKDDFPVDYLDGSIMYGIRGKGEGTVNLITGNNVYTNEASTDYTAVKINTPINGFLYGYDEASQTYFSNGYPIEGDTDISTFDKQSAHRPQLVGNLVPNETFITQDSIMEESVTNIDIYPEWNMPHNPELVPATNNTIGVFNNKMTYPVAEAASNVILLSNAPIVLALGDQNITQIDSINNITEFSDYATVNGNEATFTKSSLVENFGIEVHQPVSSFTSTFKSEGILSGQITGMENLCEYWYINYRQTAVVQSSDYRSNTPYAFNQWPLDVTDQETILGNISPAEWYKHLTLLPSSYWDWNPADSRDPQPTWQPQYANVMDDLKNDLSWTTGSIFKPSNEVIPLWRRTVVPTRWSDTSSQPALQKKQQSREIFSIKERFNISDSDKISGLYESIKPSFGLSGSVLFDPRNMGEAVNNSQDTIDEIYQLFTYLSMNIVATVKTKGNNYPSVLYDSAPIYCGKLNVKETKTDLGDGTEMFLNEFYFGAGRASELNSFEWDNEYQNNLSNLIDTSDILTNISDYTQIEYIELDIRFELNHQPGYAFSHINGGNDKNQLRIYLISQLDLHKMQWNVVNEIKSNVTETSDDFEVEYEVKWKGTSSIGGEDSYLNDVIHDTLLSFDEIPPANIGAIWDDYRGIPYVAGTINNITSTQKLYNNLCSLGDYAMWYNPEGTVNFKKWMNDIDAIPTSGFVLDHAFDETNILKDSLTSTIQKSPNEIYNQIYVTFKLPNDVDKIVNIDGSLVGPFPSVSADWQSYAEGVSDYTRANLYWNRLSAAAVRSQNNKIWEKTVNNIRDEAGIQSYLDYVTKWHVFQKTDITFDIAPDGVTDYTLMQFCSFTDEWITGSTIGGDPVIFYGWITAIKRNTQRDIISITFTSYIDPREICVLTDIDEGQGNITAFVDDVENGTGATNPYADSVDQQFDIDC